MLSSFALLNGKQSYLPLLWEQNILPLLGTMPSSRPTLKKLASCKTCSSQMRKTGNFVPRSPHERRPHFHNGTLALSAIMPTSLPPAGGLPWSTWDHTAEGIATSPTLRFWHFWQCPMRKGWQNWESYHDSVLLLKQNNTICILKPLQEAGLIMQKITLPD